MICLGGFCMLSSSKQKYLLLCLNYINVRCQQPYSPNERYYDPYYIRSHKRRREAIVPCTPSPNVKNISWLRNVRRHTVSDVSISLVVVTWVKDRWNPTNWEHHLTVIQTRLNTGSHCDNGAMEQKVITGKIELYTWCIIGTKCNLGLHHNRQYISYIACNYSLVIFIFSLTRMQYTRFV